MLDLCDVICNIKEHATSIFEVFITGHTHAKPSNGAVDSTKSHFQPNAGITIRAKRTSKHAPSAQKH